MYHQTFHVAYSLTKLHWPFTLDPYTLLHVKWAILSGETIFLQPKVTTQCNYFVSVHISQ